MRNVVLACAVIFTASTCFGDVIPVQNGDFSLPGNNGTLGSPLLGLTIYDANVGSGPWSAQGTGVDIPLLPDLLAPQTAIGGGVATISGLTDLNVAGLGIVNNQATIYQNNVSTWLSGQHYTLTASFSSPTLLTSTVLSEAAFGISLRRDGIDVIASNTSPTFATIQLLDNNNGLITLEYDSTAADAGHALGVSLFAGHGTGLANLSVLGQITFDNVGLTAVPAAVPEPGTLALLGLAAGSLGVWYRRRRRGLAASLDEPLAEEPRADLTAVEPSTDEDPGC